MLHPHRYFNSLQSECFPVCFHSDVNMVVSAPTGSGKTVLFELCILRLLSRFISEEKFVHVKGTLKTVSVLVNIATYKENIFVTLMPLHTIHSIRLEVCTILLAAVSYCFYLLFLWSVDLHSTI